MVLGTGGYGSGYGSTAILACRKASKYKGRVLLGTAGYGFFLTHPLYGTRVSREKEKREEIIKGE
jgi:hypothetical protein